MNEVKISSKGGDKALKIIKCGVFINKDSKIEQIQNENVHLKQLIEAQMSINKEYTQKLHQNRTKILDKLNQNNIFQLEAYQLQQEIKTFEKEVKKIEPTIKEKQQKVQNLSIQIQDVTQELQNLLKHDQKAKALIQRYRDEIKKEKQICKSDTNLHKIRQDLSKKMVNYDKNIDILTKKLESKTKYLATLTKKLQKQQQSTAKKIQAQQAKILLQPRILLSGRDKNVKKYQNNKEEQTALKNPQAMKDYNNLIRKKNEILNSKK